MGHSISSTSSACTDQGKVRSLNEDAVLNRPDAGLWAVADGMGGHDAGDYASSTIVKNLSEILPCPDLNDYTRAVYSRLQTVNNNLLHEAHSRSLTTIGSTVIVLLAVADRYACIWAGDSRLYRLRQGVLEQISRDHSEVQSLLDQGLIGSDDVANHPSANVITRAVGAQQFLELDAVYGQIQTGDKYLLCSDGLYNEVSEQEIAHTLQFSAEPKHAVAELLRLTLSREARDNTSILSVNFKTSWQP